MKYQLSTAERETHVKFEGDLRGDLAADFTALCATLRGDRIVFDLGGINQINSPGIAQWIEFLRALTVPYEFRACPVLLVDYANLWGEVFGKAKVVSFHVPYRCKSCEKSFTVLMQTADLAAMRKLEPTPCPTCTRKATSDVDPADYLMFLKS